jgi:hypothetical protein
MPIRIVLRWIAALVFVVIAGIPARAAPVETNLFAVTGIEVDIKDTDAATAKNKAIIEAQLKGFRVLAERFGGPEAVAKFEKLTIKDVGRLLRSLSIEEERTGPGQYIGKLTVRFLPDKVRGVFGEYGLPIVEEQSPAIVLIPVWKAPEGALLWEDNPWKAAWTGLKAEQAIVPIIIPLGDLQDTQSITAEEAIANDAVKLEAIMMRYEAQAVLVAIAEPAPEGGVRAVMLGDTPIGKVTFDKVYLAEDGTLESSLVLAAQRFHGVMIEKWRQTRAKLATEERARQEAERRAALAAAGPQQVAVSVPFASVIEWNAIRNRLAGTPGIVGVDVASIAGTGAMVRLSYAVPFEEVQTALAGRGMQLNQVGDSWVLQAF